jgi:hypothetical protein
MKTYFILLSTLVLSIPVYSDTAFVTNEFIIPQKSFNIDSKDLSLNKIKRRLIFVDGQIVSDDIVKYENESHANKKASDPASYCEISFKYDSEKKLEEENEHTSIERLEFSSTHLYDRMINFGNTGLSYSIQAYDSLSKMINQTYHMGLHSKEQAFNEPVLINGNRYKMNVANLSCHANGVKGENFSDLNERHFAGIVSLGFNHTFKQNSISVSNNDGNREAKIVNDPNGSASQKPSSALSK